MRLWSHIAPGIIMLLMVIAGESSGNPVSRSLLREKVYGIEASRSIMTAGKSGTPDSATVSRLRILSDSVSHLLEKDECFNCQERIVIEMESLVSDTLITDTLLLSDALFYIGFHHYRMSSFREAYTAYSLSVSYRKALGFYDRRYATGLSNMAVSLFMGGDYREAYPLGIEALEAKRVISGNDSSSLVNNYLNLASICLELNENSRAVELAEAGLAVSKVYSNTPRNVSADLYHVIGLSLYRGQEYNKSLFYCREALRLYGGDPDGTVDSRILMHNTMALVYNRLEMYPEAEDQYKRGLKTGNGENIQNRLFLYINYADFLAKSDRKSEAEALIETGLGNVRSVFGSESREYIMMLASAADFASSVLGDNEMAITLFDQCFTYQQKNPRDQYTMKYLAVKYARSLYEVGKYQEALALTSEMVSARETLPDGAAEELNIEGLSEIDLSLLTLRYLSLNALSQKEGGDDYLREAVATGRTITSLYDRLRLEMSEDESRIRLSADTREIYTGLVENYVRLYEEKPDKESLEKVYEFSERSKLAGFLASVREVNASRFSLPAELSDLDATIRREIDFYRELMANEQLKAVPDSQRLVTWEGVTFRLLRSRDSLAHIFEENYPAYYALKFRNEITPLAGVKKSIGSKANLLSYVLDDNKLTILIINSRSSRVVSRTIDSDFYSRLQRFREMLSSSPQTTGSRVPFNEYMDLAHRLYRELLEPVVPYLHGDKIVISPDNILSYIPFETLVTEEFRSAELLYRDAPFALKRYRFSYIYSVTLSSEMMSRSRKLSNSLIAFAPSYEGVVLEDSLLVAWPDLRREVRELPFALVEAEDAVGQCGGKVFLGEEAREEVFKREVQNFDIVHLAMHTLLDDRRPAFSKMLFAAGGNESDDGLLNTYEVYTLPLKAMMVVLSSCNTGAGMIRSGEGILSLARGFLYAGSRSVVMSMWEVEDASASEVIHSFYKNMRGGQTKSAALRNARLKFLQGADQSRSHPYYWSALVIYGDDTALWYDRITIYVAILLSLLTVTLLVALRYRGPRS